MQVPPNDNTSTGTAPMVGSVKYRAKSVTASS